MISAIQKRIDKISSEILQIDKRKELLIALYGELCEIQAEIQSGGDNTITLPPDHHKDTLEAVKARIDRKRAECDSE